MEKRLTGVRIALSVDGQEFRADCSLFLESYGPPARWRGRLWNFSSAAQLKRGTKVTLTLPQGTTAEATIQRAGQRGGYDFQGEGLPPTF
jgi:hypothetical protein